MVGSISSSFRLHYSDARSELLNSAAKEFRGLPTDAKRRVRAAIDLLVENPRHPGVIKLQGRANLYRVRVGDYRVIYEIHDDILLILLTRIRHRKDVYQD
ncbi:MAG: type II toxin-antitoxin system RelE/ParE family toxin [Anaerolineae bacterium]